MEEEKQEHASTSLLRIVSPTPSSHRTSTLPPLDQLQRKYDYLQFQLSRISGTFSLKQKGQQKKNLQERLDDLENQIKDLESQDSNYPSREPSPTPTEKPDVIFMDEPTSTEHFYEAESVIEQPPPEPYPTFPPSAFLPPPVLPPVQPTPPPPPPPPPPAQVMAAQPAPAPKELSLQRPDPFTGDRTKLRKFILKNQIYLSTNAAVYDTEFKKISFTASLLKDAAEEWLTMWIEEKETYGLAQTPQQTIEQVLETTGWLQFITDLRDAFKEIQAQDISLDKLERLRQGRYTTEDFTIKFKNLAGQSGLTDDRQKIRLYQKGLDPRVLQDVMKIRPLPTTFQQWTEAAAEEDNQYRRAMQMIGKPLKTPIPFQKKFAY